MSVYSFATAQKVLKLGDVVVGGQPGEYPTLLFGTAFYGKKYRTLSKDVKERVRGFIAQQERMAEMTGNPCVVDIFIDREEHIGERIELVLEQLPEERVFSVDVPEAEVRVAVLQYLSEHGLLHRTIYNSLNIGVSEEEIEHLRAYTPLATITLAYNPKDLSTDGRIEVLENGGRILSKGLITLALDLGIENLLIDTAATPFEHGAGEILRSVPVMKQRWGWPVGCSIHNTVESWLWLKNYRERGEIYKILDVGANGLFLILGGDFSIYGSIASAKRVFPFVAMVDKFVSEGAEEYFGVLPRQHHPRRLLK